MLHSVTSSFCKKKEAKKLYLDKNYTYVFEVFVSSTCYDLSQIRRDLFEAISGVGYSPIMSEFNSFPVDPSITTVDNCIKQVKESADILVLIIGGRHGSLLPSGKSITNLEYSAAKLKKIPIYTFIKEDVLNLLTVYAKNHTADFSAIVDDNKIFDFVNEIKSDSKWYFPFASFQDIIQVLKTQWSNLFKGALKKINNIKKLNQGELFQNISANAAQIYLEKSTKAWEYEFFAQMLVDVMNSYKPLKNDYDYKFILNGIDYITEASDFIKVLLRKNIFDLYNSNNLNTLMNDVLKIYIAPEGTPSDLMGLYYCAITYGKIFKGIIESTIEIASIHCTPEQEQVKQAALKVCNPIVSSLWDYPFETQNKIVSTVEQLLAGKTPEKVSLILTIDWDKQAGDKFWEEIKRYKIFIAEQAKI